MHKLNAAQKLKTIGVSVPPWVAEELQRLAEQDKRSLSYIASDLIESALVDRQGVAAISAKRQKALEAANAARDALKAKVGKK